MTAFGWGGFYTFTPHIAVFLGLIALGLGFWIWQQSKASPHCPNLGKFLGILISVVAALGLICIGYLTIKRCCDSNFGKDWQKTHLEWMKKTQE